MDDRASMILVCIVLFGFLAGQAVKSGQDGDWGLVLMFSVLGAWAASQAMGWYLRGRK